MANLHELAVKFNADKGPRRMVSGEEAFRCYGKEIEGERPFGHGYTYAYEREFEKFGVMRPHPFLSFHDEGLSLPADKRALLEVGIQSGRSLVVWDHYFPRAWSIVGLELKLDPVVPEELPKLLRFPDRVHMHEGDSTFPAAAERAREKHGLFDVVIDDGSHYPVHQTLTLKNFWPLVKPGGIYVVEDLDSSWWVDEYRRGSLMPLLGVLTEDCVGRGKFAEWSGIPCLDPVVRPEEQVLFAVRYYRNMVVLEKRA